MVVNIGCYRIGSGNTGQKPVGMSFLDRLSWMGRPALNLHSLALWAVVLAGLNKK